MTKHKERRLYLKKKQERAQNLSKNAYLWNAVLVRLYTDSSALVAQALDNGQGWQSSTYFFAESTIGRSSHGFHRPHTERTSQANLKSITSHSLTTMKMIKTLLLIGLSVLPLALRAQDERVGV